jgi:hypothetical protein
LKYLFRISAFDGSGSVRFCVSQRSQAFFFVYENVKSFILTEILKLKNQKYKNGYKGNNFTVSGNKEFKADGQ